MHPPPQIPPISGLAKKLGYWKTTVKGVILYYMPTLKKSVSDLKNRQQYCGRRGGERMAGTGQG